MKNSTLFVISLFVFSLPVMAEKSPVVPIKVLASHVTNKMVVTAVQTCSKKGYKVAASVVSRSGDMLAFLRNPLAGPHTVRVSERKAYSAATFQTKTSQMQSRNDLRDAPGILLITGGVPINIGGQFYGGIAVAGADPKVDEQCAEAGIASVADELQFLD